MPEPFFTDHAWKYATDPEYRRRQDRKQRWVYGFWLLFFAVLALYVIYKIS